MPTFRGGPRWNPDIKNGGGWLLVDLLDAHAHGEPKIEFWHHDGGGRLLVDLKDVCDSGKHKMELRHHHGSRRSAIIMDLVEEPIWHSYLFVRMCVIFVILRVRVSLLSRDMDKCCVQWDPYLKRASQHVVCLFLIWSQWTWVDIFNVWTRGEVMKCLASLHIYFIWIVQSYSFYQRNRSIVYGGYPIRGCSLTKNRDQVCDMADFYNRDF